MLQHAIIAGSLRRSAILLIVLCSIGLSGNRALAEVKNDPWQTYINAAANAFSRSDLLSAEAMLKAALDVAEKRDPQGLRPSLTRMLLQLAYTDLDQMEMVQTIGPTRIDLAKAEEGLLPVTKLFYRLANTFYGRWQRFPADPPTEAVRKKKTLTLEYAARCLLVEIALERKLYAQTRLTFDQILSLTKALYLYGNVLEKQGSLEQGIEQLEQANDLWETFRLESDLLLTASQQASVLPRSVIQEGLDDFLEVKDRLAIFYRWKGEALQKDKKGAEAAAVFTKAERLYLGVLRYFEDDWPDHPITGKVYFFLGLVYASWNERFSDAEAAFRRSLPIYEALEGRSENVIYIVKTLVAYLRKAGKGDSARELEKRYGVSG